MNNALVVRPLRRAMHAAWCLCVALNPLLATAATPAARHEQIVIVDLTLPDRARYEVIGERNARAQIAAGKPIVIARYGMMISLPETADDDARRESVERQVLARFNVQLLHGGCVMPSGAERGYYNTMEAELLRRYGKHFWERVDTEVAATMARTNSVRTASK